MPPPFLSPTVCGRRDTTFSGREITLTPKEFDLLTLLARHPGGVITRQRIMPEVWHTNWLGTSQTIDVHIVALRRKTRRPARIEAVHCVGLRPCVPAAQPEIERGPEAS
jgi:DNA-binding response OmpR family regulator